MSTNKFQYWPSNGQLGSTKFTIPTNAEDWPSGDALVGNFVYSEGKLVDFIDIKGLTPNTSKTTTIPYDYINIELPFAEDAMTIERGPRNKYFYVTFNDTEINLPLEIVEGGPWIPDASEWNQKVFQKNKELKIVRVENNIAYTE